MIQKFINRQNITGADVIVVVRIHNTCVLPLKTSRYLCLTIEDIWHQYTL